MLDAGVDPRLEQGVGDGRRNAAHEAYEHHGAALCRRLLQAGARYDINLAAALGDFARAAELLHADASLVADDSTGLSPLGWAAYGQRASMIPYLLQRGAVYRGEMGCSAAVGNIGHVREFLDAGADPNQPMEGSGDRPLHAAAAMAHTDDNREMVGLLIDAGAKVNGRNHDGQTPLDVARARLSGSERKNERAGFEGVIRVLEKRGGLAGHQIDSQG